MFTMKVFPTVLKPNGIQHYQCSTKIDGVFEPVHHIGQTYMEAIAGCLMKTEAKLSAVERMQATRLHVDCMCSLEEESQVA